MIKINGKEFRNPQEQLAYNTEEIEKLKETIKDAYKTSSTLTSSSVSDTRANTNVPEGVKSAWIMTSDGLLFKITGNDGTTLLLTYYSDLKGPQGADGASISLDDSGTSQTKAWSSYKTNQEIGAIINDSTPGNNSTYSSNKINELKTNGFYYTTESLIVNDSTTVLKTNLSYPAGIDLKVGDLIFDTTNSILGIITQVDTTSVDINGIVKIGGKQLYEHNIDVKFSNNSQMSLHYTDDSSTPINSILLITSFLTDNGFTSGSAYFTGVSGTVLHDSNCYSPQKIYYYGGYFQVVGQDAPNSNFREELTITNDSYVKDYVRAI